MKPTLQYLIYSLMIILVTACSDGGGGSAATPTITSFVASTATITAGSSVNLTAVFANGTGSIDNGVGNVSSNVAQSVSPASTTTYTLTVTNTPGVTVISTVAVVSTVTVTVIPAPTITSFVASVATITAGSSVDLIAVFAGGTGSVDNGVGSVSSNVAQSVTPASTTTYIFTLTDGAGTAITASVTVTVVAAPTITSFIASAATITAGSSVNLTAVFADGTANIDNGVGSVSSNVAKAVTPAATTIYTLTVTNGAGTAVTSAVTVTVVASPTITSFIASAATITAGSSVNLTAVFADGTASIDSGVGSVSSNVAKSVTPTATTTYTVTATNGAGTAVTAMVTVTVVAAPTITSFDSSAVIITVGSSVDLTAVFADGTASIDNGVGSVSSNVAKSVTPAATTTYTVTVTNGAGTAVTSMVTVTVVPAPTITSFVAQAATITAGDSVALTAFFADGTGSIDNVVGSVSSNVAKSVSPASTTTYTLTVTNGAGTAITEAVTVTVVPALTITSFVAQAATITAGSSVDLIAVFAGGTGSIDNGVGNVSSNVAKSVTPAATTTYILTVTNAAGTTVTATVTVTLTETVVSLDLLSITSGNLDQIFQSNQLSYTATVGFLVKSIKIQATTTEPGATIKVNNVTIGSDNFSQDIALAEGANAPIFITVTTNNVMTTYSLTVERQTAATFAQQAYVKASNTENYEYFGRPVSLSGDTMAVSAEYENSAATGIGGDQADNSAGTSGAVYVFIRSGTTWTQQAYIKASNTDAGDYFGSSLSLSGDTLAVGAMWEDSAATGINGDQADNSAENSGAVYVFTRSGATWTQEAYIKASNTDAGDRFGYAGLSLSGDTLAVGVRSEKSAATGINGNQADNSAENSGAVYVFTRSGATWTQEAYIKASNTDAGDCFGFDVSLSGDTLAVGAYAEDSAATGIDGAQADNSAESSGAVYVFTRSGTTWTQEAYIKASNTDADDLFGYSVSLSGDTLAVGAYAEDSNATGIDGAQADNSAESSGAVYVFTRSGTMWTQEAYIKASNTDADDLFGFDVSLSGDTLAVGTHMEDSNAIGIDGTQGDNSALTSGAVYVLTRSGTVWIQQAYVKASNTEAYDGFGWTVSLSGDTLAVGAMWEDSAATGINGIETDNSAANSGAVYVFE